MNYSPLSKRKRSDDCVLPVKNELIPKQAKVEEIENICGVEIHRIYRDALSQTRNCYVTLAYKGDEESFNIGY